MRSSSAILLALCLCLSNNAGALSFSDFFGPRLNGVQTTRTALAPKNALDSIHRWNAIAINASGLDHTPVAPGEIRTFGEQLGPGRSSRAMAIVHIAIFDSVNAVLGGYRSYTGIQPAKPPVSLDAAVAQAAHDSLIALYPSQAPAFDSLLTDDLAKVSNKNERTNGVSLGQRAAAAILALRASDGSQLAEPRVGVNYFTSDQPGHWRQDPISVIPLALGAHWGDCKTFVVQSASQFRVPPPPDMNSAEYARANTAMADAGMSIWESKYYYDFWRPIGGIRESDLGTGPTGLGDSNASTTGDLTFTPMGAPASNLTGPNFTPPFPSYPSGHGGFGGALFQTLRRFFGTDNIAFTIVSDEFNGVTKDNAGNVRPYVPRSFANFSQAEEENGQSRIYLGIHWSFDKTQAIAQGRNVANYVFDHAFTPVSKK